MPIACTTTQSAVRAHAMISLEIMPCVRAQVTRVPLRAQAVRGLALELERVCNHVGDLGALCNDVGYLPGAAYFGRMRGDFLNLTALICGNRFGRHSR